MFVLYPLELGCSHLQSLLPGDLLQITIHFYQRRRQPLRTMHEIIAIASLDTKRATAYCTILIRFGTHYLIVLDLKIYGATAAAKRAHCDHISWGCPSVFPFLFHEGTGGTNRQTCAAEGAFRFLQGLVVDGSGLGCKPTMKIIYGSFHPNPPGSPE